jgi:hypothetical protein
VVVAEQPLPEGECAVGVRPRLLVEPEVAVRGAERLPDGGLDERFLIERPRNLRRRAVQGGAHRDVRVGFDVGPACSYELAWASRSCRNVLTALDFDSSRLARSRSRAMRRAWIAMVTPKAISNTRTRAAPATARRCGCRHGRDAGARSRRVHLADQCEDRRSCRIASRAPK